MLELPCAADTWDQLEAWLINALSPLLLPVEFSAKLFDSARASAACILPETWQLRLAIITSATRPARGQIWGFFRILKEETRGRHWHSLDYLLPVCGRPR
jgi:hypothetical protein